MLVRYRKMQTLCTVGWKCNWYVHVCMLSGFSHVQLIMILWTVAQKSLLSLGFSRLEYWSGLHVLLQGIFLTQGLNMSILCLLYWQIGSLPLAPPRKPHNWYTHYEKQYENSLRN